MLDRAVAALPRTQFVQAYGMTELSPIATVLHHREQVGEGRKLGRHRSGGRATFGVQVRIVAGDRKGCGIRMAADHRNFVLGWHAGGFRQPRGLAEQAWRLVAENHLNGAVGGDGPGGKRERALERIKRRLFALAQGHGQLKATLAVDWGKSSPKQR